MGRTRFLKLRARLLDLIRKELAIGDHHKSYEGYLVLEEHYGNYFESLGEDPMYPGISYNVHLDCYVLGGSRHYDFKGEALDEALDRFETFLDECEKEQMLDD